MFILFMAGQYQTSRYHKNILNVYFTYFGSDAINVYTIETRATTYRFYWDATYVYRLINSNYFKIVIITI